MNNKRDEILNRMLQDIVKSCDKREVYIVEGAPGAGKTTFVQKNKKPGDLIIDLDLIAAALQGSTDAHPDYEPVMEAVLAAREAVYNVIEGRKGKWNAAYIITSNPDIKAINKLAERLRGKVVSLNLEKRACIEHIMQDNTRTNRQNDIEIINKWYERRV